MALTIVAATAWAYWSAGSVAGGNGAAAATSVNQGATPTASAAGSTVTVSWAASTLATGRAVSGYLVKRYDAATLAPQTILLGLHRHDHRHLVRREQRPQRVVAVHRHPGLRHELAGRWRAPRAPRSRVDSDTPPTNAITLSSVTGGAFLSGTTLYYRGVAGGQPPADQRGGRRRLRARPPARPPPSPGRRPAGRTRRPPCPHPPAAPTCRTRSAGRPGTTSGPGEAVTGRDVAGNTAVTNLTFVNDSTAPTAGTITYANGFSAGRSVSVSFTTGTDGGSGIATRQLQRAVGDPDRRRPAAPSAASPTSARTAPTSPYVDSSLASGCYMYRYVVTDRVGNQAHRDQRQRRQDRLRRGGGRHHRPAQPLAAGGGAATLDAPRTPSPGHRAALLTARTRRDRGHLGAPRVGEPTSSGSSTENRSYRNGCGYSIDYTTPRSRER